jgi:von Willebrand factor type A domain
LIILDRSGSMADSPSSGGASKWDQMTTAIDTTVTQLQGQIKWGLEMFPHDNDCGVSTSVDVPIGANDAAAISSSIAAQMPDGSTPTTAAINAGAQYLSTVADSNPKYILLATDGEPNCSTGMTAPGGACTCPAGTTPSGTSCCILGVCLPCTTLSATGAGGDDTAAAEQAVTAAATAGVHTFVIGIATDPGADGVLNQMAQNGLEARPGATQYYPVANQNDLVTAVNTIAGQIISCSFAMQQAPPNPDFVEIDVNNSKVPRDTTHMDGWDFGPGDLSIQFYGSYCMSLQNGSVMNVEAIFQCMPVS